MALSDIIRLRLDSPRMTPQQLADQVLVADQEARRQARAGEPTAADARIEADALADVFSQRYD